MQKIFRTICFIVLISSFGLNVYLYQLYNVTQEILNVMLKDYNPQINLEEAQKQIKNNYSFFYEEIINYKKHKEMKEEAEESQDLEKLMQSQREIERFERASRVFMYSLRNF